jgi:hypothetical protein
MSKPEITTTVKHTVSVKQRTEVGDEVFISVGQEYHNVPLDEEDSYKEKLSTAISEWLETRVSTIAGAAFESYSDPEEGVADSEDEEEAEESEDENDEDELTIEDVQAMKVGELRELIEAHELDVDPKLKVKELREAIIAELFAEEDEDEESEEDDEEDEDEESEEDEGDEEEGDEEEEEPYTEDELKALKLAELQEIAEAWELKVKHKKGADLKAKKADFVKAIIEAQEG